MDSGLGSANMKQAELTKLVTFIEENLRASPIAGLQFVDSRQTRSRLVSRQNHVVFGRRGAGKTALATSVREPGVAIDVYLNLEDYKAITFPNIIIKILVEVFEELKKKLYNKYKLIWLRKRPKRVYVLLNRSIAALTEFLHKPDIETQKINTKEDTQSTVGGQLGNTVANVKSNVDIHVSEEVSTEVTLDKLDYLRLELSNYKKLLSEISDLLEGKAIFLILDDFYFISKEIQPDLVDYFHTLTKGTNLFIKIATIQHRSKLYRRSGGKHVGVELGADVFAIDMDYTLDKFDELRDFMWNLLTNAISTSKANVKLEEIFAGDGFSQLCLASGGVPRDFLSYFVSLAKENKPIGKVEVTTAAISALSSKFSSMEKDSGNDSSILEQCLGKLKNYVYVQKRTNGFVIAKSDLEAHPMAKQAIKELVDLRLIHLLEENTSKAQSDGRRYEAYILDLGLYDNPKPRSFKQIEPGYSDEQFRKDALRGAPVFELTWFDKDTLQKVNDDSRPEEAQLMLGLTYE